MGQDLISDTLNHALTRARRTLRRERAIHAFAWTGLVVGSALALEGLLARIGVSPVPATVRIGLLILPIAAAATRWAQTTPPDEAAAHLDSQLESGCLMRAALVGRDGLMQELVQERATTRLEHAPTSKPLLRSRVSWIGPLVLLVGATLSWAPGRLIPVDAELKNLLQRANRAAQAATEGSREDHLARDDRQALTSAAHQLQKAIKSADRESVERALSRFKEVAEALRRGASSSGSQPPSQPGGRSTSPATPGEWVQHLKQLVKALEDGRLKRTELAAESQAIDGALKSLSGLPHARALESAKTAMKSGDVGALGHAALELAAIEAAYQRTIANLSGASIKTNPGEGIGTKVATSPVTRPGNVESEISGNAHTAAIDRLTSLDPQQREVLRRYFNVTPKR